MRCHVLGWRDEPAESVREDVSTARPREAHQAENQGGQEHKPPDIQWSGRYL